MRNAVNSYYTNLKNDVLVHYAGNKGIVCTHCEGTDRLGIDHINDRPDRKRQGSGYNLYQWLKKNNYPPGYQILCNTCNIIKGIVYHTESAKRLRNLLTTKSF